RHDQAEQGVGSLAGLEQLELRAAGDHLLAEADEALDDIAKSQGFGPAAADREHVGREARLRRRVAPQLIEHDLRRRVPLQVDDDAHALAIGLIPDVRDTLDALVLGGLRDLFDKAVLADLIRDFGENDRTAVAAAFLDMVTRAHEDRAATGGIGPANSGLAEDEPAGREIR